MVACNPTFDQTRVCKVVFVTSWAFDSLLEMAPGEAAGGQAVPTAHGVPTWRSLPGEASPAATWARLLPWPSLPPSLSDGLWGSGLEDLLEKPRQGAEQSAREEGWAPSPGNAPGAGLLRHGGATRSPAEVRRRPQI